MSWPAARRRSAAASVKARSALPTRRAQGSVTASLTAASASAASPSSSRITPMSAQFPFWPTRFTLGLGALP